MPRSLVGATVSLALVAFVAGCTEDESISQRATFDDGTSAGSKGTAFVLVGLRVLTEPTRHGPFNLFSVELHPTYMVRFRGVTEDGRFGRNSRTVKICETTRPLLNGAFSDCMPDVVRYKLLAVPPGRYTVDSITYRMDRVQVTTTFNEHPSNSIFDLPAANGQPVLDPGRSFVVEPGSVTYVGELVFYFDPSSDAAKMTVTRQQADAEAFRASFPNVHGTLVFQLATGTAPLSPVPGTRLPFEKPL